MTNQLEDVLLPQDKPGVICMLATVRGEEAALGMQITTLMAEEDLASGINHAAEVHQLKHVRLVTRMRRERLEARLRRLESEEIGK